MSIDVNMEIFVHRLLDDNLPPNYYYHNFAHTRYVLETAREIATYENCTDSEIALISMAALWHDSGFIHKYVDHEAESCRLARLYLPNFGYDTWEIEAVCAIIHATIMPQEPRNKLGEIIADADLAYLGTPEAFKIADMLYREIHFLNPSLTKEAWRLQQISFIKAHDYFTAWGAEYREAGKQAYLEGLEEKENK
ncbi:MAG: HD domain-containing protein [Ferruginibacter sp.]